MIAIALLHYALYVLGVIPLLSYVKNKSANLFPPQLPY